MRSLFITATGTNIGKTHTTLKLIEALAARGFSVGVFKPIETGVSDTAPDATILLEVCRKVNRNFADFTPADITAYTFPLPAAPFCADTEHIINIDTILEKYRQLSKRCDILLVEGAGGLMVPVTKDFFMIDLAKALKSKVLLVTPSQLGCINDTLLSMEALETRKIPFEWCVNLYEDRDTFAQVTQPYYNAVFPGWWTVEKGLETFVQKL
ncbi:dethiobiotin synthase [Sulfurovum riftiae]|uniref:ATP-dependent dethiobiotin synthetase BioD n=1 Tax=Sulfurovum riftiae TaxID=1630136 RepID=A0A151CGJ6_9BACT|nr:dethiobiotin synthase [Sulfurovum riftiae]KYJ86403.1 ATP-dependent dethiobiotin synthetase BioD [Sulfurovum riftiae]